jgi:putative ABC transport system ATP-binding protein
MIEIINLEVFYNNNILQSNINFKAEINDFIAIIGKSGSGKSTLLNIIGLLQDNYSGTYKLDGVDVKSFKSSDVTRCHKNKIGFLFQNFALIDDYTVYKNLNIIKTATESKIDQLMDEFNLSHVKNRRVYELSGGEQQRVAFIRLLLQDPDIILIDEPGANLDPINKQFLLDKIFSLKNKIVLIVTHDQEIGIRCNKVVEL